MEKDMMTWQTHKMFNTVNPSINFELKLILTYQYQFIVQQIHHTKLNTGEITSGRRGDKSEFCTFLQFFHKPPNSLAIKSISPKGGKYRTVSFKKKEEFPSWRSG